MQLDASIDCMEPIICEDELVFEWGGLPGEDLLYCGYWKAA
jgi:hypothetical protein